VNRDPNAKLVYATGGMPVSRPEPEPAARLVGGIRLRVERRASDRIVTVVTGLPGKPQDVAALARALKSACAAGGALKDGTLELQGDHRARVEAELAARGLASKRAGGSPRPGGKP
jgi:translation initiation factor 1